MSVPSDRPGLVAELFAIVVAEALIGVDLSLKDWLAILDAHSSPFSMRRALFDEPAGRQVNDLVSGVAFNDNNYNNEDLACRIAALPLIQKIAVLDVVDRFWSDEGPRECDHRASLEALGVVFNKTVHQLY